MFVVPFSKYADLTDRAMHVQKTIIRKTFGQRILCDHRAISRLHFEGTSADSQSIYLFSK